jgi:hypothetical protein
VCFFNLNNCATYLINGLNKIFVQIIISLAVTTLYIITVLAFGRKLGVEGIARYGYAAIPQDYNFLSRHAMLNIYYEILKSYTSGMSVEHLDRAVRQHAALQLGGMNDIGALCAYRKAKGNKETKRLLGNNTYYWKVLLNEIKKRKP